MHAAIYGNGGTVGKLYCVYILVNCFTGLNFIVLFSKVIDICAAIINIFHLIPAASIKLIEPLIQMVLKVENALLVNIVNCLYFTLIFIKVKFSLFSVL